MKSLDRIIHLRPQELPVRLPNAGKALPKNVNEPHLHHVLLQHVQVFVVTPRIAMSTLFSVGSKKEAGLEEISSKTVA